MNMTDEETILPYYCSGVRLTPEVLRFVHSDSDNVSRCVTRPPLILLILHLEDVSCSFQRKCKTCASNECKILGAAALVMCS